VIVGVIVKAMELPQHTRLGDQQGDQLAAGLVGERVSGLVALVDEGGVGVASEQLLDNLTVPLDDAY
jgi:hypothetical protein